jgi:hypothetical protein
VLERVFKQIARASMLFWSHETGLKACATDTARTAEVACAPSTGRTSQAAQGFRLRTRLRRTTEALA